MRDVTHLVVLQSVDSFPVALHYSCDIIIRQGQVTCLP